MAKGVATAVLDLALNDIKNNGLEMTVLSGVPATYTDAHTTLKLAGVTMASTDYTLAAGDTSGRKVTTASKTGISVSTSGTATYVAINDTTNSILKLWTTCTSQAINTGGTVDVPGWKWEIQLPT